MGYIDTDAMLQGIKNWVLGKTNAKAGKPSGTPTNGNLAALTSNGDLTDSGKKASDFAQATDVADIQAMIPNGAGSANQLADKAYVNSSVATATSTFRGTYNLVSDLLLTVTSTQQQVAAAIGTVISTADNNDYCFVQVPTADATPTEIARIDRYKYNDSAWSFEYTLNNSGFTSVQWAAINSGITTGDVSKLSALPTNAALTTLLAGKQDTINDLSTIRSGAQAGATAYQKPGTGIPKADLSDSVQTSLGKADTALQQHQDVSGKADVQQIAYYECPTASDTAAKVVTAPGFVLPVTGGAVKVKMSFANTAENPTLNINSTGAKPLYYDGAAASASNTWEAGETLDLYYDGTNWMANNVRGGGKFAGGEKVKEIDITDYPTKEELEEGEVVPLLTQTLLSWLGANLRTNDTQAANIFFTGGNESIDSSVQAQLQSLTAKSKTFAVQKIVSSGKNLLRLASNNGIATALTGGYYFPVPAMSYGLIGTAAEANGVLFVNSQGQFLTPTVRFSTTVPTAITDGQACTYTDAQDANNNTLRFYTTPQAGYMIVSGITWAETCARIAWSGGSDFPYNRFVSPTAEDDAGSVIDLSTAIHALHSYDLMLHVGSSADSIVRTSSSEVVLHKQCDRVQPTWTNTLQEDNETYLHTATIATMKEGGTAVFATSQQALTISGQTLSYADTNATAISDYVLFELATEVTATQQLDTAMNVEDYGVIVLLGAEGEAYTNINYGQNIPDSLRALVSAKMSIQMRVIAEALVQLYNENQGLKAIINDPTRRINAEEYRSCGFPMMLSAAGAPNASVTPNEWTDEMGVWTGVPMVPGQEYFDTQNNKWYKAKMPINGAVGDWLLLN